MQGRVRALVEADVPAVAALHRRVFGSGAAGDGGLEAFLREIFCRHPWTDAGLPSLVCEQHDRIVGCAGVMPRPMSLQGRRLTAVVCHDFMVDPEARAGLAALQLAKAVHSGPQDLTLADGNAASRRIWEGLGGATSLPFSLRWRRPLRPVTHLLGALAASRPALGTVEPWLRRPCGAVDGALRWPESSPLHVAVPRTRSDELSTPELLRWSTTAAAGRSLRPIYDEASLEWLLRLLDGGGDADGNGDDADGNGGNAEGSGGNAEGSGGERGSRPLARALVRDAAGDAVGCYLFRLRPSGIAEVVQIRAREGALPAVLGHLFHDALRRGAVGVCGQVDPPHLADYARAGCLIDNGGTWMLVRSRQPRVVDAVRRGDAVLSRLECEGWIRLAHDGSGTSAGAAW